MGIWQRWSLGRKTSRRKAVAWPMLDVGYNVRELGGYDTPHGRTASHRFLRSGETDMLSERDVAYFHDYGVGLVVDLRSEAECRVAKDDLARESWIDYANVPLYNFDLHDPALDISERDGGYLASGYLTMLANRDAVRQIFSLFADAREDECVLFHCAAGMDRTGVTAMLLLGLAGVDRKHIIADYVYSYGTVEEVDQAVFEGTVPKSARNDLAGAINTMATVYDRLTGSYGSVRGYLTACGLTQKQISAVRNHLLG